MPGNVALVLLTGLLAGIVTPSSFPAEPPPYGHKDFVPTSERPVGYRGDGSGHFPGATPPLTFNEKDGRNVRWSIKMPGWSQSSPIVVGKYIITAAEPDTTLCVDADTGKVLWQDALGLFEKDWRKSGGYSFLWSGFGYSWPCSDGERVYKAWIGGRRSDTTAALVCYDLKTGQRAWMWQFSGDFQKYKFTRDGGRWAWKPGGDTTVQHSIWEPTGYGSPQLYGDLVIYHAKGLDCALVALDKRTGALRWASKPNVFGGGGSDTNFVIVTVGARRVLVTNTGTVLDPKTGDVLGEALPSVEKDGKQFSRLWGLVEKGPKGEVKVAGVTPAADPEGRLAFGPDWARSGCDGPWDQVSSAAAKSAPFCYLVVRLGFDGAGKLTTSPVFPERAVVPRLEYGNGHLTLVKDHLVSMPGYGNSLAAIALDTGKMAFPVKALWTKQPPFKGNNVPSPAPDANDPKIRAALDEFGLTVDTVVEFNRGIGRNGDSSYSRTFVDASGCIWYMNRQARLYRIDPSRNFASELAGALDHPTVWTSCSSPFPHGNRVYVRTFGRLACIEDAQGEPARLKAAALRERIAAAPAADPLPVLIEAAGDNYEAVRRTAARMLRELGARAVPALTQALTDANPLRRGCAALTLGEIGVPAASAVPALATAFAGDAVAEVRMEAGRALKAIGRTEGLAAAVVRAVDDPNVDVRKLAVVLLAAVGPDAAGAVPSLTKLLRADLAFAQREWSGLKDGGIRDSRFRHSMDGVPTLDAMGRMGAAAVPPLIELLKSGDELAIRWACRALGRVGPAAAPALPALRQAATDANPGIRAAAEGVVKALDSAAPSNNP